MADISQIKLPNGNVYNLKDAYAREILASGLVFNVCYDGTAAPVVANIPAGVVVTYNNTEYTGTMAASSAEPLNFYLVKEHNNVYSEYVSVRSGAGTTQDPYTYTWEKLGDTSLDLSNLGALAYKDTVTLNKGTGTNVLGTSTTFTNGTSSVTFTGGTSDSVLGADTTFTVTQPTITVTPTTTRIKATASGTAVGADGTANAITGFGTHSTQTFVKSVSAESDKKLVVTSITPTNGTESVSSVSKTTKKLVTTSIPNVTSAGTASTWSFSMGDANEPETLIISGTNSTAATLGAAITAATGSTADSDTNGATVVTAVTISNKTVAKAGTAVTVATGAVAQDGTGDAVVTGITIGDSASAITGLGTPTTASCLTGVKVTTQPTVALATGAAAGTGVVSVATGITSATATNGAVAADSNDSVTAVTGIGTGTAAAQTITVGTNNQVKVAKYTDLSVTVS